MLDQISDTIKKYNMLEAGDEVITALSGGADSVCLLLALNELKTALGIKVSAIHVNHCLRGDESDRDEMFCRRLCKANGIPLVCGSFDVKGEASELGLSTEQAARNIRYRFFAEHSSGKKIATAHNANDNAETVIFNLTRGTGTKGAAGIPPVRGNIIRPLLRVTREEIEKYLLEKKQEYVTDSTNLTDDYTRNKIRHNVLPVLSQINPSLIGTITAASENLRTDNDFIEAAAEKAYSECLTESSALTGLDMLHPAIRRRCISRLLSENNIEVNSKRISDIDNICGRKGKINLSGNIYIISEKNSLYIKEISSEKNSSEPVCYPLKQGTNLFKNKKVEVIITDCCEYSDEVAIDADKLKGTAVIRGRLPGDRIKLAGKSFTSSVKKLLQSRFDVSRRENICFIADDDGPVFIEETGIADRAAPDAQTKKIMIIKIQCE